MSESSRQRNPGYAGRTRIVPNQQSAKANNYLFKSAMDRANSIDRSSRKLPAFMYGATYPRQSEGSGGPSYGGALEWMKKNRDYIDQTLKYVQKYPNLIQENVMDDVWEYLQPLVYNSDLLMKYDDFLQNQFGFKENFQIGEHFMQPLPTAAMFFKSDAETRRHDYSYPVRRAYFCYDRTSKRHNDLKHLIVDQLEPFLSVRTNPTAEQAKAISSLDICRSICGSVFIMLLNDNVFTDEISLHLLSIAIAYRTPIIFIRESGYQLPTNIADAAIKCVKIPDDAPFRPQRAAINEAATERSMFRDKQRNRPVCQSNISSAADSAAIDEEVQETGFVEKIKETFKNAIVFDPLLFEATMTSLYEKVAAYTGANFPGEISADARVTAQAFSQRPKRLAHMKMPERPLFRAGSARTTSSFHHTVSGEINLNTTNNNNNMETSENLAHSRLTSAPPTLLTSQRGELPKSRPPTRSADRGRSYRVPYQYSIQSAFPSDSRLVKFRPDYPRPTSGRVRILLQSTIDTDTDS